MKLDNLEKILKSYKRITVALSGGVDSAFLLAFASKVLGTENVRAITACGPHLAEDEVEYAKALCASLGVEHDVIDMDHILPILAPNPADRCYHCKKAMFSTLLSGLNTNDHILADGTNIDDMSDYRPG
ncbi:MAG: 7-cyano-7-deazaguanine synthase, partial [Firmicutes bacterium]|nr:7-cyano-7-deazaguanine synthase [Bacillota bacterium]